MKKDDINSREDILKMRNKQEERAKKMTEKAIDGLKIPSNGLDISGKLNSDYDYSVSERGLHVDNWRFLKHRPLETDTFERFDNPLSFQTAFERYVRWTRNNPFVKREVLKSGLSAGEIVEYNVDRPLTVSMFLSYIKMSRKVWENKKKKEELRDVITAIEDIISANQIDGALIGAYDAPFVSRLNKIGDNVEVTERRAIDVNLKINGVDMPKTLELDDSE